MSILLPQPPQLTWKGKITEMVIVVDTSVVIAVIANEPEKAWVIALTRGSELAAPASIDWEIGNAFSAMVKQKRISPLAALEAVDIYRRISIRKLDTEISQSVAIAAQFGIYAYDAYFIRCALKHELPLLTLDTRLASAAKQAGVNVLEMNR